jgi:hypothetical protein
MSSAIALGGAALAGGAVVAGYALLRVATRPVVGQVISSDVAFALLLATALLLLGLPALYAVQATATGMPGVAGHALLTVGLLLLVLVAANPLLHPESAVNTVEHPVLFGLGIALALGFLLVGVTTLQAGILPSAAALLLLGAMAGFVFVFFIAEFLPPIAGQAGTAILGLLLATSLAWLGVAVWQQAGS